MFKPRFTTYAWALVSSLFLCLSASAQPFGVQEIHWKQLMDGMYYVELNAPDTSVVNDSRLSILKLDPSRLNFEFLTASEHGLKERTAPDWATEFNKNVIINAGMYDYNKSRSNQGYMKNYMHYNNREKSLYNNAMLCMHPKDTTQQAFEIMDITCQNWESLKPNYHSYCQVMRMMSCEAVGMEFKKRPDQSCSMIIASTDMQGNIYILFTRSPYTHLAMIKYLQGLPLNLRTTAYLEGGPEASLYINTGDTIIAKYGSYVSNTCNNDNNDHFWEIPNVIAISSKK
jgi:hypothetical protein